MGQKKLGLALGGGGARGLAHIGVLKVLEQAGITVHCIAGTSMGAIVGAAFAGGMAPAALEQAALDLSKRRHLVRMAGISVGHSLISGKKLRNLLIEKWGMSKTFEQLNIPVAAITTSLDQRCSVAIMEGPVIDAVMASSSFPGVLPAVEINDEYFADGFIFNNVPADVTRQLGAEVVLAVDVIPMKPERIVKAVRKIPAKARRKAPGISQTLYQAVWMMVADMSQKNLSAAQADIILFPPVPANLSIILGFTRAAEAIAAGEHAAAQALDQIKDVLYG